MLSRVGASTFFGLVGFGFAVAGQNLVKCPVVLDGRVPAGTPLTFFDTSNTLFNPDFVKGNNLKWSQILQLPNVTASRFDAAGGNIPVEVTISDASIFQSQNGFRRAGLQFAADSANDASDTGIKTIHFSVKQDPQRKLNLTHEYLVGDGGARSIECRLIISRMYGTRLQHLMRTNSTLRLAPLSERTETTNRASRYSAGQTTKSTPSQRILLPGRTLQCNSTTAKSW